MCASGPFPGRSEGRSWVKSKKYLKDQSGHWTRHGHQRRPFPFYGGEGEKMRPTIVENSSPSFWTNLLQALGVVRQEWWDALQVAFVLFCHFERGMHCQPNDICKPFAPCCYDHNRAGAQVPEEARARHCQHRLAPRQHALHGDRAHYTRWPPARQIVPGSSEMTNYNWTSPKKTKCSRLNLLWQKKTVKFEESWSNQIQQMNN